MEYGHLYSRDLYLLVYDIDNKEILFINTGIYVVNIIA